MFQKKIIEKYLSKLDAKVLAEKYETFRAVFGNDKKIENIRQSKEEQYQEGFIRDLFVAVLGYTIKPEENYNILTELKNEVANKSNSKKSDGAICEENNENKIRAVIELKGTDTTDLDKVAFQGFSYKNFHNECNYVIVSNFERLRLYVETQIEFLEFNLFALDFDNFCLLYLLLEINQLKSDVPLKLKHETVSEEKQITDNFYADYSTFKRLLFEDLVENNPGTDKLLLFKKTQKLLDRILFVLFCEDRNLLPPNSVAGIIGDYQKLKEMGYGQPLYNVFKNFFSRIDAGYQNENDSSKNVFAYNGGLFKADNVLDSIKVGDDVLFVHSRRLADYDFESQISVDILGRIFENSLTEIEEVQKELGTRYEVVGSGNGGKYGNIELSGIDCVAESDGFVSGNLQVGEVTSERGNVCTVRPNETSVGLDSIEHSGGQRQTEPEGVCSFSENSQRLSNRIGNSASIVPKNKLFETRGNNECTNSFGTNRKNDNSTAKVANDIGTRYEVVGSRNSTTHNLEPTTSTKREARVGKRKKDGVFYTPEYITKYIVENTIGKICGEKKEELKIIDEDFSAQKKYTAAETKELEARLKNYRAWLLDLKICDPACGSGAFLNAALHELRKEHYLIDRLWQNLFPLELNFEVTDNTILENNLYGVDINADSVEITKLSLWLHTAKKNRKLTTLNDKIKCGNSLTGARYEVLGTGNSTTHNLVTSTSATTHNPEPTTYFDWEKEFPEVFVNGGGFDVVIGNPPYVQLQSMGAMSDVYAKCGYESYNKSADIYCLFYERGVQLLKEKGMLGFIASNKWLKVNYGESLRNFIVTKTNPVLLVDFPGVQIFPDATVDPQILVLAKEPYKNQTVSCVYKGKSTDVSNYVETHKSMSSFTKDAWRIIHGEVANILKKIGDIGTPLKDLPIEINYGVKTGYNDAFFIDEKTKNKLIAEDAKSAELIKPLLRGRDINAWYSNTDNQYLICTFPAKKLNIENYPAIKNHLLSFGKERLEQSGAKGSRKKTSNDWFETQDQILYYEEFSKPKIIYPNMTSVFPFAYDEKKYFGNDKTFIITAKDETVSLKALTAIFNSKLCKLWIWHNCPELGDDRREIRKAYFENFCVPLASERGSGYEVLGSRNSTTYNLEPTTSALAELADKMLSLNESLQKKTQNFLKVVKQTFGLEKVSAKLENFYELDFDGFIKELKTKVSPKTKMEWLEVFEETQKELLGLKAQIEATDGKINSLVYKLYGLTAEEIAVVENS